jgi:hypothetical protein
MQLTVPLARGLSSGGRWRRPTHLVAWCARRPGTVEVKAGEIVGWTMEQPRHAGHDDLAHVAAFGCFLAPRMPYMALRIWASMPLRSSTRESGSVAGERDDGRHPPVAIARMTAVAGFAMDSVAPTDNRCERDARPAHDRGRTRQSRAASLLAFRIDRIIG